MNIYGHIDIWSI